MNNLSFIRFARITVLLILISPAFVAAQSDKNAAIMAQADTLLGKEDYNGALALYNKIIDKS